AGGERRVEASFKHGDEEGFFFSREMAGDGMLKGKGGFTQCSMQECQRHTPWLANSPVAARQAQLVKMAGPAESVISSDQELAAPHSTVIAVTGSVKNQADDLALQPVLGHAGSQM